MSKTQVVAAIIQKDRRFLIGKRSPHKIKGPGVWSPISGRMEPGETQRDAVVREVWEEVGLRVNALKHVTSFDIHGGTTELHWWTTEILSGEATLKNDEHTEIRWVTLGEMKMLKPIFKEDIEVFEGVQISGG
jgi:8-oxo-dGTP pyrophosphatase MutT (NUDIX family)